MFDKDWLYTSRISCWCKWRHTLVWLSGKGNRRTIKWTTGLIFICMVINYAVMSLHVFRFLHVHAWSWATAAQFYSSRKFTIFQLKIPFRSKHVHITRISSVVPGSSLPPTQESKLQSHRYQCFKQSAQHNMHVHVRFCYLFQVAIMFT